MADPVALHDAHAFVLMAYGDSPFLEACLASLAEQTQASPVVITTSTPSPFITAAAERHGARLLVNERKAGIASDWNFALEATDARRVTLAHQDDVYFPRFGAESLARLQADPAAVLCFTGYEEIDDDGRVVHSKISTAKHLLERMILGGATRVAGARLRTFLAFGNPLPCSSATFDRARLAGFRFSDAYRSNLDWEAWLRLQAFGAVFARTAERLVGRRHNPLTETARLIKAGVRRQEDLEMFRRLWPSPIAEAIAWVYRAGY